MHILKFMLLLHMSMISLNSFTRNPIQSTKIRALMSEVWITSSSLVILSVSVVSSSSMLIKSLCVCAPNWFKLSWISNVLWINRYVSTFVCHKADRCLSGRKGQDMSHWTAISWCYRFFYSKALKSFVSSLIMFLLVLCTDSAFTDRKLALICCPQCFYRSITFSRSE